MSKEVKRYDPVGYDGLSALMHEDADGGWVRVENYEALCLELAEANADFVRIANELEALLAERDALKALLVSSREFVALYVNNSFFGPNARMQLDKVDAALQGEQP